MQITCLDCKEQKEVSGFYIDRATSTGRMRRCIPCYKARRKDWVNPIVEARRVARFNKKNNYQLQAISRLKFPEKYQARQAVQNAVRLGKLNKPKNCLDCGLEKRLSGHHEDYSKQLEVVWLCAKCHEQRHHRVG